MKKLYGFSLLFFVILLIAVGGLYLHSIHSIEQEEVAEARYFADTLFDQIETGLIELVIEEENRPVNAYDGSALNRSIQMPYLLAYFQNDQSGNLLSSPVNSAQRQLINRLNTTFQTIKGRQPKAPVKSKKVEVAIRQQENLLEQKYLSRSAPRSKELLKKSARKQSAYKPQSTMEAAAPMFDEMADMVRGEQELQQEKTDSRPRLEYEPMMVVMLDETTAFLYRKVKTGVSIRYQGVAIDMKRFSEYLADTYFASQPMSTYGALSFRIGGQDTYMSGQVDRPVLKAGRSFSRPFTEIESTILFDQLPASSGRQTLLLMTGVLVLIIILGLGAILKSIHVIVEHSRRRAGFVSSVTHELKTPITNVGMYVEMLEQGMADTPEKRTKYFHTLKSEILRLSKLIQNILEFSKLESRTRKMNLETGDVGAVVEETVELMQQRIVQDGFDVELSIGDDISAVYDREALLQILINLIDNSLKFGQSSPEKQIMIDVNVLADIVEINVSDTGPGIPEKEIGKIFDDFYRVDNSLTSRTQGTGIGLALVKKLMIEMGGSVSVQNNEKEGCIFRLRLGKA